MKNNIKTLTCLSLLGAALASAPAYAVDASTQLNTNTNVQTGTSVGAMAQTNTDWSSEDKYWRDNFRTRPYAINNDYDQLAPAYEYGFKSYSQHKGKDFKTLSDSELRANWEKTRGNSTLTWEQARDAARDSYNRVSVKRPVSAPLAVNSTANTNTNGGANANTSLGIGTNNANTNLNTGTNASGSRITTGTGSRLTTGSGSRLPTGANTGTATTGTSGTVTTGTAGSTGTSTSGQ